MTGTCAIHGIAHKRNSAVALAELERKLRLENMFKREIRSIFRRMLQDFRAAVARSGRAPSAERYEPQWRAALQVQYERVHREFRGEVATQNGRKSIQYWTGKQVDDLELLAFMEWSDDVSARQADIISGTNDVEMQRAIDDARNSLQADNQLLSLQNIAAAAMAILATRFVGRTNLIAQTETQAAAEATKQIEAEIIAGTTPFPLRGFEPSTPVFLDDAPLQAREIIKVWDTVGDNRVRPSHVAVDGTSLSVDGIFTLITGSKLRFAGDMLLGASIADLANCRCSTRYEG